MELFPGITYICLKDQRIYSSKGFLHVQCKFSVGISIHYLLFTHINNRHEDCLSIFFTYIFFKILFFFNFDITFFPLLHKLWNVTKWILQQIHKNCQTKPKNYRKADCLDFKVQVMENSSAFLDSKDLASSIPCLCSCISNHVLSSMKSKHVFFKEVIRVD